MIGQDTWDNRVGQDKTDDTLERIDVATGAVSAVAAPSGTKEAPFLLPSGDIGYLRRDQAQPGVSYASGRRGPAGAGCAHAVLVAGWQAARLSAASRRNGFRSR